MRTLSLDDVLKDADKDDLPAMATVQPALQEDSPVLVYISPSSRRHYTGNTHYSTDGMGRARLTNGY